MGKDKFYDPRINSNILNFNMNIDQQLTSKANFLFGASTLILVFIIERIYNLDFSSVNFFALVSWIVLLIGSFISSLTSLLISKIRSNAFGGG